LASSTVESERHAIAPTARASGDAPLVTATSIDVTSAASGGGVSSGGAGVGSVELACAS
jgi:hypothetical protein